jgi:hypothetical protein
MTTQNSRPTVTAAADTADVKPGFQRHLRKIIKVTAVAAATALVIGGVVFSEGKRAEAIEVATAHYSRALSTVDKHRVEAAASVDATTTLIAESQKIVDDADGKVLDEAARDALVTEIDRATSLVGVANQEQKQTSAAVKSLKPEPDMFGRTHAASAKELARYRFESASHLTGVAEPLAAADAAVTGAVAAWQTEQDRIAAEAAAAEAARVVAAQAAADRAAAAASRSRGSSRDASAPYSGGTAAAPSSSASYTKNVWTSGFQSEINACRGAVDVTANYGTTAIAEHWSCGGRSFPTSAGTIVTLTGVFSGTYRIVGIVAILNLATNTTADVPHGYDMIYQTCINGSSARMSLTAMIRIG